MVFSRIISVVGCLMGASGVIAAAVAAHGAGDTRMSAAAQILLVHAAASLALTAPASASRLLTIAVAVMQAGAILFAADMAVRVVVGHALLPYAAPVGGTGLIAAWLLAALGFAFSRR